MLNLEGAYLIGKGYHRACYVHPNEPGQCIKVVYNGNGAEQVREKAYYKHLQNRAVSWNQLPKYFGEESVMQVLLPRLSLPRPSLPLPFF